MTDTANSPAADASPELILQIGMGFFASKALLSAVELGLFTQLRDGGLTADEISERLGLHERSRCDFLDALVSLGLLDRDGNGAGSVYRNTPDTGLFLDKQSPAYLGGILEMANARLYGFWGTLTEALLTGDPQSEIKSGTASFFEGLYVDPERLKGFLNAMEGVQIGAFIALSAALDLSSHDRFCDLGGASGLLSALIATANPKLTGVTFDLPPVAPIAEATLVRHEIGRAHV